MFIYDFEYLNYVFIKKNFVMQVKIWNLGSGAKIKRSRLWLRSRKIRLVASGSLKFEPPLEPKIPTSNIMSYFYYIHLNSKYLGMGQTTLTFSKVVWGLEKNRKNFKEYFFIQFPGKIYIYFVHYFEMYKKKFSRLSPRILQVKKIFCLVLNRPQINNVLNIYKTKKIFFL